jgi:hypothetical protein
LVENGATAIRSCCDPEQTADVLTKPLPQKKHKQHTEEMGLAMA